MTVQSPVIPVPVKATTYLLKLMQCNVQCILLTTRYYYTNYNPMFKPFYRANPSRETFRSPKQ